MSSTTSIPRHQGRSDRSGIFQRSAQDFWRQVAFSIRGFRFRSGSGFSVRLTNVADPDIKKDGSRSESYCMCKKIKTKKDISKFLDKKKLQKTLDSNLRKYQSKKYKGKIKYEDGRYYEGELSQNIYDEKSTRRENIDIP